MIKYNSIITTNGKIMCETLMEFGISMYNENVNEYKNAISADLLFVIDQITLNTDLSRF